MDLHASAPYRLCELNGAAAGVPRLQRAEVSHQWPLDLLATGKHISRDLEWIGKA